MKHRQILVLLLLPAVGIMFALLRQSPGPAQLHAQGSHKLSPTKESRQLVGATSCSASVCHGGGAMGEPLSEATTWRALDPHARAYETLLTPQSREIARHLWDGKTAAHEAPLCLKCHVHPQFDQARPNFRRQDGVSCESCHGAAQDWLTPHYRAGWKDADKKALGFADTKGLVGRANVCVTCHVGTPDANVDHDLIAAGHPALRFEFATYFANLPPHWDVAEDKRANSSWRDTMDFEARAWAIGQLVSASCALQLFAHRADPANGRTWPEFAELDCFSCHHDLQQASWRQKSQYLSGRKPGSVAWNDWYFNAFATSEIPVEVLTGRGLVAVRQKTQWRADLAMAAGISTKDVLVKVERSSKHGLLHKKWLQNTASLSEARNWDEATQRYLAMLSLRQLNRDQQLLNDNSLDQRITKLRELLTFPTGFNSPKGLDVPFRKEK